MRTSSSFRGLRQVCDSLRFFSPRESFFHFNFFPLLWRPTILGLFLVGLVAYELRTLAHEAWLLAHLSRRLPYELVSELKEHFYKQDNLRWSRPLWTRPPSFWRDKYVRLVVQGSSGVLRRVGTPGAFVGRLHPGRPLIPNLEGAFKRDSRPGRQLVRGPPVVVNLEARQL
jgi:hypothetical protein